MLRAECEDRLGRGLYEAQLLHEFGKGSERLTTEKIQDLWIRASKFSVLFSDHTEGKLEPFLSVLLDPRSVWMEFLRLPEEEPVGVGYISDVIPFFDAKGHFAFWDSVAGGRQPLIHVVMAWVFKRYNLHRMTAEIPRYQAGVLRFTRSLGFVEEGITREGVLYKGSWGDLIRLGITWNELVEKLSEVRHGTDLVRGREEWDTSGDEGRISSLGEVVLGSYQSGRESGSVDILDHQPVSEDGDEFGYEPTWDRPKAPISRDRESTS